MKYTHTGSGAFDTKQLSIDETITEASDVVAIAKITANNISDNVSPDVKKELDMIIKHLDAAEHYLSHVRHKAKITLQFVPNDVQEKEYL